MANGAVSSFDKLRVNGGVCFTGMEGMDRMIRIFLIGDIWALVGEFGL